MREERLERGKVASWPAAGVLVPWCLALNHCDYLYSRFSCRYSVKFEINFLISRKKLAKLAPTTKAKEWQAKHVDFCIRYHVYQHCIALPTTTGSAATHAGNSFQFHVEWFCWMSTKFGFGYVRSNVHLTCRVVRELLAQTKEHKKGLLCHGCVCGWWKRGLVGCTRVPVTQL